MKLKVLIVVFALCVVSGSIYFVAHLYYKQGHAKQDYDSRVTKEWKYAQASEQQFLQDRADHAAALARMIEPLVMTCDNPPPKAESTAYQRRRALILAARLEAFVIEHDSLMPKLPRFPGPLPTDAELQQYRSHVAKWTIVPFNQTIADLYLKDYYPAVRTLLAAVKGRNLSIAYARHYCVTYKVPPKQIQMMPVPRLQRCVDALRDFALQTAK